MTAKPTAVGARRRLAQSLKDLRRVDGRSLEEVAAVLGWSAGKLSRLETGARLLKPQVSVIEALLDVYGITAHDPETKVRRDQILQWVEDAREADWWSGQSDALPPDMQRFLGLESEAVMERTYEKDLIPGLLQTRRYARSVIESVTPGVDIHTVMARLDIRFKRQDRRGLWNQRPANDDGTARQPLAVWAIIGEAALRTMVGGPDVMREQLEHLLEAAALPNVTVQIIPFSAGVHPGTGPFVIMSFPDDIDPETVYVDTVAQTIWRTKTEEVAHFRAIFENLIGVAAKVEDTVGIIQTIIAEIDSAQQGG